MSKNMDAILQMERGDTDEQLRGAVANFVFLPGGRAAWQFWPDDPDTPELVHLARLNDHLFVVSEDVADLHAAIEQYEHTR